MNENKNNYVISKKTELTIWIILGYCFLSIAKVLNGVTPHDEDSIIFNPKTKMASAIFLCLAAFYALRKSEVIISASQSIDYKKPSIQPKEKKPLSSLEQDFERTHRSAKSSAAKFKTQIELLQEQRNTTELQNLLNNTTDCLEELNVLEDSKPTPESFKSLNTIATTLDTIFVALSKESKRHQHLSETLNNLSKNCSAALAYLTGSISVEIKTKATFYSLTGRIGELKHLMAAQNKREKVLIANAIKQLSQYAQNLNNIREKAHTENVTTADIKHWQAQYDLINTALVVDREKGYKAFLDHLETVNEPITFTL